jgi:hypothetical protein
MATTKQLIDQALRTIGVLASGEEAKPAEVQDALVYAQQMLDSWANDNLMLYAMTEESFTLSAQRTYTIGDGGDFDTVRPTLIKHARIRDSGGLETPVKIASQSLWAEIPIKDNAVNTPDYLYYKPEYPLGKIEFSSVPVTGDTLKLTTEKPLTDLPALTAQVTFPPGYDKVIRLGLAIELAPEYGKSISQEHAALYASAMKSLKRTNSSARMGLAKVDRALTRRRTYDINHGPS